MDERMNNRTWATIVAPLLLAVLALPARAQDRVAVSSPGDVLTVELFLQGGIPHYEVKRRGAPVIAPSRLGFMLRGDGKFGHGVRIENPATRSFDETWEQP